MSFPKECTKVYLVAMVRALFRCPTATTATSCCCKSKLVYQR